MTTPGSDDVRRVAELLAARLPTPLRPLAELAYNYWWSWTPGGRELFESIDPYRWQRCRHNPVRLLTEAPASVLLRAAGDSELVARARSLIDEQRAYLAAPWLDGPAPEGRPIAFFCTEYGIHRSLPVYAGGLGILAGDLLKEASDRRLPYAGIGILYRQGYFHQRLDTSGWQHEYWSAVDAEQLPAALVMADGGQPLVIDVPVWGRTVYLQVWRVDVGRVPLYLLDAERPENSALDRWITSRLYVSDRVMRLAQYAVLGVGGVRALRALGVEPSTIHLNEGHVALAVVELLHEQVRAGRTLDAALQEVRRQVVFTTHTPVAAGNETCPPGDILSLLSSLTGEQAVDQAGLLALGRADENDEGEPFGLTPFGVRTSRHSNGVSRRHGSVARHMWQQIFGDTPPDEVPIGHVTNGVHLPSWMAPRMRALLDRHLPDGWHERAADPETWKGVDAIPDIELWETRNALRAELVASARERAVLDRLSRGDTLDYVEAGARAFDPDTITLGFARRATAYKRLYLLAFDPQRAMSILDGPHRLQLLLSGKPHPQDEEAKRIIQDVFELRSAPIVADRVAYLEDYDMEIAAGLVSGCDVWINLPRYPLEASGTSGMKAALNGALNLSVADGWWEEAWDGTNGWTIRSDHALDPQAQDAEDAAQLYDLLEREILPLFYDRDDNGIPAAWLHRVRASLRTIGPGFCATRMLDDYMAQAYRT